MPIQNADPLIGPRHWGFLAVVVGFSVVAGAYGVSKFSKQTSQQRFALKLARRDVRDAVEKKPLAGALSLDDQKRIARGAGLDAVCILHLGGKDVELQQTPLIKSEADPSIEKATKAIRTAEAPFANAIERCNAVTVEKTIVLVDRTRAGVDAGVGESLRDHLCGDGGLHEAIPRGNGIEVALHPLSDSSLKGKPLVASVPPATAGADLQTSIARAKQSVEKLIAEFEAVPMGDPRSAVAVTIRKMLSDPKPASGTHIVLFSDYFENDEFTGIEHIENVPLHQLNDPRWRSRVLDILRTRVPLPDLAGLTVDMYLLPVPSQFARMVAMSEIFALWMSERGATVKRHESV